MAALRFSLSAAALCALAAARSPPPSSPPSAAACAIAFNDTLGDNMVLQQGPARSAVFGVASGDGLSGVSVQVSDEGGGSSYSVAAEVGPGGLWKALLHAAPQGGNFSVVATASCAAGAQASAAARNVVFGDVWYCSGQSNAALSLQFTLARNDSLAAIAAGRYANIRIQQMAGNMNAYHAWTTIQQAAADPKVFLDFSATCYYFGESLTDALGAGAAPPLGLVHVAWGGSTIQQWIKNSTLNSNVCANHSSGQGNDGGFYETRVLPYSQMTLKGFVWYQGVYGAE